MTWQTKQIKQMISRTRQPDQTELKSRSEDQNGVGQGESFPLPFIVNLDIWKCIRHSEAFSCLFFIDNQYALLFTIHPWILGPQQLMFWH